MSPVVKLAGGLPQHEALNGLISLAGEAISTPGETWVGVVVLDVKSITTNLDTNEVVPTFRVKRIEPIDGDDKEVLGRLVSRAHERRTGKTVLPLDMEDDIREAFRSPRGRE